MGVKKIRLFSFFMAIMMLITMSGCSNVKKEEKTKDSGKIYLYGESHGKKSILEAEFDLWYDYYHNEGMRHLFIEWPYYSAEFLNLWMKAEDDTILEQLFADQIGTAGNTEYDKEFYKKIKKECPETIFHGTDVGHQYVSTGNRYLQYLKEEGKEDSEQYRLAEEAIEQGRYYYTHGSDVYRENKMVENFIREFDSLENENIMGIYGAAHTDLDSLDYTGKVECMGTQLKKRYGDIVYSEDLTMSVEMEPERIDVLEIAGKEYKASYFGARDVTGFVNGIKQLAFWRIENAYDDFKDKRMSGDYLPKNNYPTAVHEKEVWLVEATATDGMISRRYYISHEKEDDKTYNFYLK